MYINIIKLRNARFVIAQKLATCTRILN
jgi:hypothetical protein